MKTVNNKVQNTGSFTSSPSFHVGMSAVKSGGKKLRKQVKKGIAFEIF